MIFFTELQKHLSYAEGFFVVFDMRQCKITLKMGPVLYITRKKKKNS
jgi:hypothetical protein